jgi:hypothetical protein
MMVPPLVGGPSQQLRSRAQVHFWHAGHIGQAKPILAIRHGCVPPESGKLAGHQLPVVASSIASPAPSTLMVTSLLLSPPPYMTYASTPTATTKAPTMNGRKPLPELFVCVEWSAISVSFFVDYMSDKRANTKKGSK